MPEKLEFKAYMKLSKTEFDHFIIPIDHFVLVKDIETDISNENAFYAGYERCKELASANGKILKSKRYPWKEYLVSVIVDPKKESYFLELTKKETVDLEIPRPNPQ